MTVARFKLFGAKELLAKLNRLEKKVRNKLMRRAIRNGIKIAHQTILGITPVLTGKLRQSLKVRKVPGKTRRGVIRIGVQTGSREELGIPANAKYYYPAAVEFGHPKAPPHSYMRRGMKLSQKRVIRQVSVDLHNSIIAEARKGK